MKRTIQVLLRRGGKKTIPAAVRGQWAMHRPLEDVHKDLWSLTHVPSGYGCWFSDYCDNIRKYFRSLESVSNWDGTGKIPKQFEREVKQIFGISG